MILIPRLIRELVADSQGDPALAKDFRDRFFAHRRARGLETLENGIANGELRPDLDVDNALDVLYGLLWLRLLVGHRPVSQAAADDVLNLVWPELENEQSLADRRKAPLSVKNRQPDRRSVSPR